MPILPPDLIEKLDEQNNKYNIDDSDNSSDDDKEIKELKLQ